jgi:hypothetical protein
MLWRRGSPEEVFARMSAENRAKLDPATLRQAEAYFRRLAQRVEADRPGGLHLRPV